MRRTLAASLLALLFLAGSADAATPDRALFAEQSYVSGFREHWKGAFAKQSTIVMGVLLAGAIGIFIITRGRKMK